MTMPDPHTPQDTPNAPPRQDARLHIWGLLTRSNIDRLRSDLQRLFAGFAHPIDFAEAMSPGGTLLRDVLWGQMPDGLAGMLKDHQLNLAWRSASTSDNLRNSCLTHAGLKTIIRFSGAHDEPQITQAKNVSAPGSDPYLPAELLLRLSLTFGVQRSTTAHEAICTDPALRAACQAASFEDVAAAVAMLAPERPEIAIGRF